MPTLLATTFYLSSLATGVPVVSQNTAIEHKQVVFTKYIAQDTEKKASETKKPVIAAQALKTEPTKMVQPTVVPTVAPTVAPVVTTQPATAAPVSNFDTVYQDAGTKYGIPWQILYGLHITETGGRDGMIMNGSGSGARGPMQFMPGTWGAYGVDGNGDGVSDIDNAVDAIHGAANYLAKHGSLDNGLTTYGGAKVRTLQLARERGYTQ